MEAAHRRVRRTAWLVVASLLMAGPVPAQIVRGQVVDSVTGVPVGGGSIILLAAGSAQVARTVTDPDGLFLLRAGAPGQYRLRVEAQGYRASEFPPFQLAVDRVLSYVLLLASTGHEPSLDSRAPEMDSIIARVCPEGVPAGHPVIVGVVSDAPSGERVEGAEVRLSWSTVPEALAEHLVLRGAQGVAKAGSTGFFGVCGAPVETPIFLHAVDGDRVSDMVALTFRDGGVYRRSHFTPFTTRVWRQDLTLRSPPGGWASIQGTVTDTGGVVVPDAVVSVVGTDSTARTNVLGDFRLEGLPPGDLRVFVEHPRYQSAQRDLELVAGDTLTLPRGFFRLTPAATELRPVTVEASAPERRRDLSEFFKRRETTTGSFITRQEFERMGNVQRVTDILRRMRGVYIRPGQGWLEWLITTRRGMSRGSMGGECFPLVFMDGSYVGTTANLNVDQLIPASSLEAIEVHASAAGMPPEFNRRGATCGAIVFWTR